MDFQILQKKKVQKAYHIQDFTLNNFAFDSIYIMVWEIYGSKFVEFAVYCDAWIVRIVILSPSYLSNHLEYWIDHGEQNYSEQNFVWGNNVLRLFSAWFENPYFATMGRSEIHWNWGDNPIFSMFSWMDFGCIALSKFYYCP